MRTQSGIIMSTCTAVACTDPSSRSHKYAQVSPRTANTLAHIHPLRFSQVAFRGTATQPSQGHQRRSSTHTYIHFVFPRGVRRQGRAQVDPQEHGRVRGEVRHVPLVHACGGEESGRGRAETSDRNVAACMHNPLWMSYLVLVSAHQEQFPVGRGVAQIHTCNTGLCARKRLMRAKNSKVYPRPSGCTCPGVSSGSQKKHLSIHCVSSRRAATRLSYTELRAHEKEQAQTHTNTQ